MKYRLFGIVGLLGVLGCESEPTSSPAPSPTMSAAQAGTQGGETIERAFATAEPVPSGAPVSAPAAKPTSRGLGDLGDVPDWTPATGKITACSPRDAARLAELRRGDAAELARGKADVNALVSSVAGKCEKARRDLATALNDGAYTLYKKKKLDEASHFWSAALNVNPAHILARYNLACALALKDRGDDALWVLDGVRRAAQAGDARATIQLGKARNDADLVSLRKLPRFVELLKAAAPNQTVLERLSKDATLSMRAVTLLPKEYHEYHPTGGEVVKHTPALVQAWRWRPSPQVELLLATVIDDPKRIDLVWKDHNNSGHYWGIAVFLRDGEKLELLASRMVGDEAPEVAVGPDGTVLYSNDELECGALRGRLSWRGDELTVHHDMCVDRSTLAKEPAPRAPSTPEAPPSTEEGTFKACDLAKVDWKNRSYDGTKLKDGGFSDGASGTAIEQLLMHDFDGDGKVEALVAVSWQQWGGGGGSSVKAYVYKAGVDCLVEQIQTVDLGISSARLKLEVQDLVCAYDDWDGNAVTERFRWKDGRLQSVGSKRVPR